MELTGKIALVCKEGRARSLGMVDEFEGLGAEKLKRAKIQEVRYVEGGRESLLLAVRQGMTGEYLSPGAKVVILDDDMDDKIELAELEAALNAKGIENARFSTPTLFAMIQKIRSSYA